MTERQADAAAVLAGFTIPGLVAGSMIGAMRYGEGPGVWSAAAKGGLLGAVGASAFGSLLAVALRSGIERPIPT